MKLKLSQDVLITRSSTRTSTFYNIILIFYSQKKATTPYLELDSVVQGIEALPSIPRGHSTALAELMIRQTCSKQ